jgi:hypothetical protein
MGGSWNVSCVHTVKNVPPGLTGVLFSGGVEGEVAFGEDLDAECVLFGDLITVSGICGLPGGCSSRLFLKMLLSTIQ